jgi:hypothetical protein
VTILRKARPIGLADHARSRPAPDPLSHKESIMSIEEITAAIKNLSVEERRKVALYILDLEKEHIKGTIGPQIAEDLESVSKAIQGAADKIKQHLKDRL